MKPTFTLMPLTVILAVVGAILSTGTHDAPPPETDHAGSVHAHMRPDARTAMAEMTVHAVHRLGAATLHPQSFGTDPNWTPDYQLQWVTGETLDDGSPFTILLATHKKHPEFRYVAISTEVSNGTDWTRLR